MKFLNVVTVVFTLILYFHLPIIQAGVVTNYNIDKNCPQDLSIYELRITDCTALPCNIHREKRYYIEADFSVVRNVTNPILKCSSVYLGRPVDLPGHGGCERLVDGQCPLIAGLKYTMSTNFKVPYYVPPTMYTVYCSLVDDDDQNMICGWGSSKVV